MMIDLLIFSRDRAAQLHLLLESIAKNSPNLFNIAVLYTSSNYDYNSGYELCKSRFKHIFAKESDFKQQTIDFVQSSPTKYICFAVDDLVVFKHLPSKNILPKGPGHVFSLRLGLNTTIQNQQTNLTQQPLNRYINRENILTWPVNEYGPDSYYGYPMSVDMHIFKKSVLLPILPRHEFRNPSNLEGVIFYYRSLIRYISCFEHSVVVNIPCNNMSTVTLTNEHAYTTEFLNQQYLDNKIIDLNVVSKQKIISCHQDIPFEFIGYRNG